MKNAGKNVVSLCLLLVGFANLLLKKPKINSATAMKKVAKRLIPRHLQLTIKTQRTLSRLNGLPARNLLSRNNLSLIRMLLARLDNHQRRNKIIMTNLVPIRMTMKGTLLETMRMLKIIPRQTITLSLMPVV